MDIRGASAAGTGTVTHCLFEIPAHAKPKHDSWFNLVPNPPTTVASGSKSRLRLYLLQDLFAGTGAKQSSGPHQLGFSILDARTKLLSF